MNLSTRLRRGGVTLMAASAAMVLSACADGFFFDPAPGGLTPIAVQYSYVGAEGPQAAGAAGAFDRADHAQVLLTAGERQLFNQRVALDTVGTDKKLTFSVELPAGSAVAANLAITLQQGTTDLFSGSASASLTPGRAAEVAVPLQGVVAAVALTAPTATLRTVGGTIRLTTLGIFASGDTLGAVAATYRALGSAVSVAGDGTVTAVSNGTAGVEATFSGKADTVTITVADRCEPPFGTIALGQTVNGTLESLDCDDPRNFAYNDWYQFTLTSPTLVRATLTGVGFEPFVGANYTDKRTLAVAANAGASQVISDYHLPAGTYLVRAGSRAQPAGPNPTGSYTLSLAAAPTPEPEAGCVTGRVATWMVPGNEATAEAGTNDCVFPNSSQRYDRYGIRVRPGDTLTVSMDAPFDYVVRYLNPNDGQVYTRAKPASGIPAAGLIGGDVEASHYFWVLPAGPATGQYTFRVESGRTARYEPCGQWAVLLVGNTVNDDLDPGEDCVASSGRVTDSYRVSAPANQPFRTTLTSSAIDPFVVARRNGAQTAGRSSTTGSASAEHIYSGGFVEVVATAVNAVSAGSRFAGEYTLTTASVAIPQEGCSAGGFRATFVYFGSSASGRIGSNDCRDLFAPDTATVTRWVDGYAILLRPSETVTVTMQADFTANFTWWEGNQFVNGQFGVTPGSPVTFNVTNSGAGAQFYTFNAISGAHQATGNYTVSFSGTPLPGPQPVAGDAPAWRAPFLVPPDENAPLVFRRR